MSAPHSYSAQELVKKLREYAESTDTYEPWMILAAADMIERLSSGPSGEDSGTVQALLDYAETYCPMSEVGRADHGRTIKKAKEILRRLSATLDGKTEDR